MSPPPKRRTEASCWARRRSASSTGSYRAVPATTKATASAGSPTDPRAAMARTHDGDGEGVVVFLIGMRVNRWWRVDRWLPVFLAMPQMLVELYRDPSSGFLGARTLLGAGGPTVVQHWRSVEDLYAYASDPASAHRPAWSAFNRRTRDGRGAVGIWHETYAVPPGGHESMHVDMPVTGLAAAVGSRSVTPATTSARARLDRAAER